VNDRSVPVELADQLVASGFLGLGDQQAWLGAMETDHGLGAALCVLAGGDLLRGLCDPPPDGEEVRREGWTWVRRSG